MNNNRKPSNLLAVFLTLFSLLPQNSYGGSALRIVGSSSVFPFAATVAEHFGKKTHEDIPIVESNGTGAGIKFFCGSLKGPDAVMTSRPFTKNEEKKCKDQGITFQKFTIGLDGLVLIQNKQAAAMALTIENLDHALSEKVPFGNNCLDNPYKEWKQIAPNLPSQAIRIFGPAPSTGTYDILIEKIKSSCGPFIRHDGAYIEAPANENLIVQKVLSRADSVGIVTFSFYDQNRVRLRAMPLNGILPSVESIQGKSYPLSRPLYVYIKTNDMTQHSARQTYIVEFTSSEAIGKKGYLNEKGLIPLSPQEQKKMQERARGLRSELHPHLRKRSSSRKLENISFSLDFLAIRDPANTTQILSWVPGIKKSKCSLHSHTFLNPGMTTSFVREGYSFIHYEIG